MSKKTKTPLTQKAVSKVQSYADKHPRSSIAQSGFVKRAQRIIAKKKTGQ